MVYFRHKKNVTNIFMILLYPKIQKSEKTYLSIVNSQPFNVLSSKKIEINHRNFKNQIEINDLAVFGSASSLKREKVKGLKVFSFPFKSHGQIQKAVQYISEPPMME
ncbi:hypothetical protein H6G36_03305 [Anabaena minutissima FACHB-250]|nr:hypothetical protein [Anabaena minutissima FACHB-250]